MNSPHPLEQVEIEYTGTIRGEEARAVCEHAEARGVSPAELMMRVIETLLADDMIDAILDDRGGRQ